MSVKQRIMTQLIHLISVFILMLMGSFIFLLDDQKRLKDEPEQSTYGTTGFCAVSEMYPYTFLSDSINASRGRSLFRKNCNQCHAKDLISDLSGPGLMDVFTKWEKDTLQIGRYLQHSEVYCDTTRNERIKALKKSYYPFVSHQMNLTTTELRSLILYLEDRSKW